MAALPISGSSPSPVVGASTGGGLDFSSAPATLPSTSPAPVAAKLHDGVVLPSVPQVQCDGGVRMKGRRAVGPDASSSPPSGFRRGRTVGVQKITDLRSVLQSAAAKKKFFRSFM
jgi:hypothetical protein